MKKDIRDSVVTKKDKPHRAAKRIGLPNPAGAEELSDADLDKVVGGAVGPCDHVRTPNKI
jgi:mersacidin/lichenicidin family type 2 lantibiotic